MKGLIHEAKLLYKFKKPHYLAKIMRLIHKPLVNGSLNNIFNCLMILMMIIIRSMIQYK